MSFFSRNLQLVLLKFPSTLSINLNLKLNEKSKLTDIENENRITVHVLIFPFAGSAECRVQEIQGLLGPAETGRRKEGEGVGRHVGSRTEEGDGEETHQIPQRKGST